LLEIEKLLDRKPSQLSGGQRQRVALGRTLVRKPKLFLLDEPIAHLDAALRHRMRGEMKRIFKSLKATVLYVTHDYMEALALADRIMVIRNGKMQQIGTPSDIYLKPKNMFVAKLLGDPPMNFLRATVERRGDWYSITVGELNIKLDARETAIPEGEIILRVRPNNISIQVDGQGEGLEARVEAVEPLGTKYIVTASLKNGEFIKVKLRDNPGINFGSKILLSFSTQYIHFFDPETKEALWHGGWNNGRSSAR